MAFRDCRLHTTARVLVAISCSLSGLAQNTASIQGSTVDSVTGKAVSGAVVIASRTTAPAARGVATSATDGNFQVVSLPGGTYNLCVQVPGDGYLATCHWGSSATAITVRTGQKLTGTKVALKAGSILKIHVDDPGQLLTQKTSKGFAPHLVMGVWSANLFYPAHVANKAATSADYQVTVPFDTSLRFTIQSMSLKLGDANRNALASNADQQTFTHASTAVAQAGLGYSVLAALP